MLRVVYELPQYIYQKKYIFDNIPLKSDIQFCITYIVL